MKTFNLVFNLNNFVRFKLTKEGLEFWKKKEAEFPWYPYKEKDFEKYLESKKQGEYYELQLHELMKIFGEKMITGFEELIELSNIYFDVSTLGVLKESQEENPPYLETSNIVLEHEHKYNENYGDDRECECGHPYYRHFDTYEQMYPIGCKYCCCLEFKDGSQDIPLKIDVTK